MIHNTLNPRVSGWLLFMLLPSSLDSCSVVGFGSLSFGQLFELELSSSELMFDLLSWVLLPIWCSLSIFSTQFNLFLLRFVVQHSSWVALYLALALLPLLLWRSSVHLWGLLTRSALIYPPRISFVLFKWSSLCGVTVSFWSWCITFSPP